MGGDFPVAPSLDAYATVPVSTGVWLKHRLEVYAPLRGARIRLQTTTFSPLTSMAS